MTADELPESFVVQALEVTEETPLLPGSSYWVRRWLGPLTWHRLSGEVIEFHDGERVAVTLCGRAVGFQTYDAITDDPPTSSRCKRCEASSARRARSVGPPDAVL
jgi:hypothetical protein